MSFVDCSVCTRAFNPAFLRLKGLCCWFLTTKRVISEAECGFYVALKIVRFHKTRGNLFKTNQTAVVKVFKSSIFTSNRLMTLTACFLALLSVWLFGLPVKGRRRF